MSTVFDFLKNDFTNLYMKNVLEHVKKQIDASTVSEEIDGYPYIQILDFFPQDYYEELVEVFKGMDNKNFNPLSKNYQDRYVYQISRGENVHDPIPTFNAAFSETIKDIQLVPIGTS